MESPTMARRQDKRRPPVRVALVLLVSAGVGLHAAGVLFITTTGTRGLISVPAPLPFILLGVVLAGLVLKTAHVSRLVHKRKKASHERSSASETLDEPKDSPD
jgi:hypothetical protein